MRKIAASVAAAAFCAIAVAGCNQGVKLDQMCQFDGAVFSIPSSWETEEDVDDLSSILWITGDGVAITIQANPDSSPYEDIDELKYDMRDSLGMDTEFEEIRKKDQTLVVCEWKTSDGTKELTAVVLEDDGGYAQMFALGACSDQQTEKTVRAVFDTLEVV